MQLIELMARQWAKTDWNGEGTLEAFWRANHAEYMGKAEGMAGEVAAFIAPRSIPE